MNGGCSRRLAPCEHEVAKCANCRGANPATSKFSKLSPTSTACLAHSWVLTFNRSSLFSFPPTRFRIAKLYLRVDPFQSGTQKKSNDLGHLSLLERNQAMDKKEQGLDRYNSNPESNICHVHDRRAREEVKAGSLLLCNGRRIIIERTGYSMYTSHEVRISHSRLWRAHCVLQTQPFAQLPRAPKN